MTTFQSTSTTRDSALITHRSPLSHTGAVTLMYAASEAAAQYLHETGDADGLRLADALRLANRMLFDTLWPAEGAWTDVPASVPS